MTSYDPSASGSDLTTAELPFPCYQNVGIDVNVENRSVFGTALKVILSSTCLGREHPDPSVLEAQEKARAAAAVDVPHWAPEHRIRAGEW